MQNNLNRTGSALNDALLVGALTFAALYYLAGMALWTITHHFGWLQTDPAEWTTFLMVWAGSFFTIPLPTVFAVKAYLPAFPAAGVAVCAYSSPIPPHIPVETRHPFRFKPATESDPM